MARIRHMLSHLWERITSSETLFIGGTSILVGLATGAGVWFFKWLYNLLHNWLFISVGNDVLLPQVHWLILFIPDLH